MQDSLVFQGIENVLLARFPELRPLVERTLWYYDLKSETPEPYPLFEGVLKEFLFDLVDLGGDDPLLPRIFSFLEEMADSSDRNVTDLLGIAILEPLVFQPDRIRRAWKYMGSKTKELARENARSGGWLENLPLGENSGGNGR
ncbi:MAG: DUF7674 family protein [Candidatus Acidiferrales bacterium]